MSKCGTILDIFFSQIEFLILMSNQKIPGAEIKSFIEELGICRSVIIHDIGLNNSRTNWFKLILFIMYLRCYGVL